MISNLSRTFPDLLRERAAIAPASTAVVHAGRGTSYAQLVRRAAGIAGGLHALGIRRGDRVGLLMENRTEWLEVLFGATMAGATLVPFSTWSRPAELEFLIADSGICHLVAVDGFGGQDFAGSLAQMIPELDRPEAEEPLRSRRFPGLRAVTLLGRPMAGAGAFETLADSAPLPVLPPGEGASAVDDAMILYTSGSTSRPKAIRLQHYAVIENGYNIGERQGLVPADRVFASVPLFWAYGGANALPATVTHGAALVLASRFEAGDALDLIERHACTAIYTLPSMTAALVEHPEFRPARTRSLRTGLTIGLPSDVRMAAHTLGVPDICNIYGSSETCGNCCVTDHRLPLDVRMASQGEPLPGVEIRIVDPESGQALPAGETGNVEVRGYLMRGYGGASAGLNAASFTSDGFFRTGDLGRIDDCGRFVFAGRSDEMIKRAGINISPAEVEDVLSQHPKVIQAGVVGTADARRGNIVTAFVIAADGEAPSVEELDTHCRSLASRYKLPDRFVICASLPTTTTGKLLRSKLRDMAEAMDG